MNTAIVSDLHLAAASSADLLRDARIQDALIEEIREAERLVLLGDVIELRERPLARSIELARPFLARLGKEMPALQVILVPGNHDHRLAHPLLEAGALGHLRQLGLEHPVRLRGASAALARALEPARLELRYPGIWLGEEVYATHGHYLDCHLRLPRPEAVAIATSMRLTGGLPDHPSPGDYERALGPVYGLLDGVAETGALGRLVGPQHPSLRVWRRLNRGVDSGPPRDRLLARAAFPLAVRALSRLLGPTFESDVTPAGIARLSLEAMREMVGRLGIPAREVIFGHTHHPGPPDGLDPSWSVSGGPRLRNTGSWIFSRAVCATAEGAPLFWPGTVTWIDGKGPPRARNPLAGFSFEELRDAMRRIRAAEGGRAEPSAAPQRLSRS